MRENCTECKNLFAVGNDHDVIIIKWNGKSPQAQIARRQRIFSVESNDAKSHTDTAIADHHGHLYEGTFSLDFCNASANKSFYRYSIDRGIERIFGDLYGSSGIGLDENAQKLYHLEYCRLLITSFDWDPTTGDLCN